MIVVRAHLMLIANDDASADAWLQKALGPQKGLTIQIVEAERELVDGH